MNKLLHFFIYVLLATTGVLLYFELQLNKKRQLLGDRNLALETAIVKLASTIETEPAKRETLKDPDVYRLDSSPVEANPEIDIEYNEILDGSYQQKLETLGAKVYAWDNAETRMDLRKIYRLDHEGNPIPDKVKPGEFDQTGTRMAELLSEVYERARQQLDALNETRKALTEVREKIPPVVKKYNELAQIARLDKKTIVERDKTIEGLKKDIIARDDEIEKKQATIAEQNTEISSLRQEVQAAKDETALKQEELDKATKLAEQLDRLLREARAQLLAAARAAANAGSGAGISTSASVLSDGDNKGEIVFFDNEKNWCIVKFNDQTMKELIGEDGLTPLPMIELLVRRPAPDGGLGKVVSRIRLRNHTRGTNYVLADVVTDGKLDDLQLGDIVFPE